MIKELLIIKKLLKPLIKELIKPTILGIFIIIGVYIHTEQTKYEITSISNVSEKLVGYHILNKKNGYVVSRVISLRDGEKKEIWVGLKIGDGSMFTDNDIIDLNKERDE